MLHAMEKANLRQTLARTRAAIDVFADFEGVLRSIRKGMAPTADKVRVEEMLRLNRQTLQGLERKLVVLEQELAARASAHGHASDSAPVSAEAARLHGPHGLSTT